jgi:hypothetical protein
MIKNNPLFRLIKTRKENDRNILKPSYPFNVGVKNI